MRLLLFQQRNADTDQVEWDVFAEADDFDTLRETLDDDAMAIELEVDANAGMVSIITVEGGLPR